MLDGASFLVAEPRKQVKYQRKRGIEKLTFCIEIVSSEDSLKKRKFKLFGYRLHFFDQKNTKKKRFWSEKKIPLIYLILPLLCASPVVRY